MKSQATSSRIWFDILINAALLFFVIHQFTVNSRLLAHLNLDSKTAGNVFDFANFQLDNLIAMIISVSYSVITAIILKMSHVRRYSLIFIAWFGIMDGSVVFIYYSDFPNFQKIGAILYAIYTLSIVLTIGFYQMHKQKLSTGNSNDDELTFLRKKLYNRRKNLKYKGADLENDPQIKELNKAINRLINS